MDGWGFEVLTHKTTSIEEAINIFILFPAYNQLDVERVRKGKSIFGK